MTLTEADVQRLHDAPVVDAKGDTVGRVEGAHRLDEKFVGVKVRLDEGIASLPTVRRDDLELAPGVLSARDDGTVRMDMGLMDAVNQRARPQDDEGAVRDRER